MTYQALYRQWRPQRFDEVVGQTHVTQTLSHAIDGKRLAHAYLLSGPRGVGKTSTARILAKAINCQQGPTSQPCGVCKNCRSIAGNSALDVIEIDAASNNGVDEIRELREKVKYAPAECRYKVYIIDEVHMLSMAAFNALLKTLEEPPEHVVFILATTEVHKIPATILSRCQRFEFHRILVPVIETHLKNMAEALNVRLEPEALRLIARAAEGGMRDAISLFDQCVAYAPESISLNDVTDLLGTLDDAAFFSLTHHIQNGEIAACLAVIGQAYQQGKNLDQFLKDYLYYLRGLLQILAGTDDVSIVLSDMAKVKQQAQALGKEALLNLIHVLVKAENEMRYVNNKRLVLEMAVIESQYFLKDEWVQLSLRVKKLEQCIQQGHIDGRLSEAAPLLQSNVAPNDMGQSIKPKGALPQAKSGKKNRVKKPLVTQDEKKTVVEKPRVVKSEPKPVEKPMVATPDIKTATADQVAKLEETSASMPEDATGEKPVLSITAIQRQWSTILQHVKGRDVITHALMRTAKPIELNNNVLVLQFENDFHRDQITSPAKSKIILNVLEKMYSQRLKIAGISKNSPISKGNSAQPKTQAPKDDMVQKALEIFGGKIVNEEGKHA